MSKDEALEIQVRMLEVWIRLAKLARKGAGR